MKDLWDFIKACIDLLKQVKEYHELYTWFLSICEKIDHLLCQIIFRAAVTLSDGQLFLQQGGVHSPPIFLDISIMIEICIFRTIALKKL